ncbi:50S ribosomal protein L21 [Candidatus Aerophobetes bacterium]|nr:50S ribosomal protein L21 [Candidatus Aerophobetes bacterium]
MLAVIEIGDKQYEIKVGSIIKVEKLIAKEGEEIILNKILMVKKDDKSIFGNPWVEGAKVIAEVLKQGKANKIIVYKFKRRKGYHRTQGHRQCLTQLKVKEIQIMDKAKSKELRAKSKELRAKS